MKNRLSQRKGQVAGIGNAFMALMVAAVAVVTVVIVNAFGTQFTDEKQDQFGTDFCGSRTDTYTSYNATSNVCYNSSGSTDSAANAPYNVTVEGLASLDTLSEGTGDVADVGIIYIVLGLLVSLVGVFGIAGSLKNR